MAVTSGAWVRCTHGSGEESHAWEEPEKLRFLTWWPCLLAPKVWHLLDHAVRIQFSHSPAVKLVIMIIEDFVSTFYNGNFK